MQLEKFCHICNNQTIPTQVSEYATSFKQWMQTVHTLSSDDKLVERPHPSCKGGWVTLSPTGHHMQNCISSSTGERTDLVGQPETHNFWQT